MVTYLFLMFFSFLGKGDLVGCDISIHLIASGNGQGGQSNSGGVHQDVIVKSSSDVKVNIYLLFVHLLIQFFYCLFILECGHR